VAPSVAARVVAAFAVPSAVAQVVEACAALSAAAQVVEACAVLSAAAQVVGACAALSAAAQVVEACAVLSAAAREAKSEGAHGLAEVESGHFARMFNSCLRVRQSRNEVQDRLYKAKRRGGDVGYK
jgi:hypothetical protein